MTIWIYTFIYVLLLKYFVINIEVSLFIDDNYYSCYYYHKSTLSYEQGLKHGFIWRVICITLIIIIIIIFIVSGIVNIHYQ